MEDVSGRDGDKTERVGIDGSFDEGPYADEALRALRSSDMEFDRRMLMDSIDSELRSLGYEGAALSALRGKACFLLWATVMDMDEKKLSSMANDTPGIVLTHAFHDLFRNHMDTERDLSENVRYLWHRTLFRLYRMQWDVTGYDRTGYLMLTQAFAMSEIFVARGDWDEAKSALEDTISFGDELERRGKLPDDIWMLLGVSSFYMGRVTLSLEGNEEGMREWYREALDYLSNIPEDFHPNVREIAAICRKALQEQNMHTPEHH